MARGKLMMLVVSLVLGGLTNLQAQSKKEVIQMLNRQLDSLQKVISAKSETVQQLEVKLARIEGAAEVNNGLIKRIETKADSLHEALMSRNATIEAQKNQIAKLTADVAGFQNQEKDLTTKNEALLAELKTYKDKPEAAGTTTALKEAKVVAEIPKEAAKPATTAPINKTEPEK